MFVMIALRLRYENCDKEVTTFHQRTEQKMPKSEHRKHNLMTKQETEHNNKLEVSSIYPTPLLER